MGFRRTVPFLIQVVSLLVIAGCGGGSSLSSPAAVESVQVTPSVPSVAKGTMNPESERDRRSFSRLLHVWHWPTTARRG